MADVFLSYSQKDRPTVELLAAQLRALGLTTWYDARLESGDSFDAIIASELRECAVVLVCWSPDAILSKWVRAEALFGYDRKKLAAAFLAPTELTPPFNLVHANDLIGWNREAAHTGWLGMVRGIAKICGRPGISGLAEALAEGTDESLNNWAYKYPDEPVAAEIWSSRSTVFRTEFASDVSAARSLVERELKRRRAEADAKLIELELAFTNWLTGARVGQLSKRPEPLKIIEQMFAQLQEPQIVDYTDLGSSVKFVSTNNYAEKHSAELNISAKKNEIPQDRKSNINDVKQLQDIELSKFHKYIKEQSHNSLSNIDENPFSYRQKFSKNITEFIVILVVIVATGSFLIFIWLLFTASRAVHIS